MTYYIKGSSIFDDNPSGARAWIAIDKDGYPDSDFEDQSWKSLGQKGHISSEDPYWRLGGSGSNAGQSIAEFGLVEDYRIQVDESGVLAYQPGTGWVDLISGGTAGNVFKTIAVPNGTDPVADGSADILTLTSDDASVTITGDEDNDEIDFSVPHNPAGVILPYGGSNAPDGYLLCDGSEVSRSTYSDLFDAIGTNYGDGDGSDTFNLPDLRGQFLRGVDDGAGVDPNAGSRSANNSGGNTGDNVGSEQGDEFEYHNHWLELSKASSDDGYTGAGNQHYDREGVYTGSRGGDETRPKNVYVNYIIKT